jgi:hypothetical protein
MMLRRTLLALHRAQPLKTLLTGRLFGRHGGSLIVDIFQSTDTELRGV